MSIRNLDQLFDPASVAVFGASQRTASGSSAWVRSGLTPGQQVVVYPPATVRDGVRVAARKV